MNDKMNLEQDLDCLLNIMDYNLAHWTTICRETYMSNLT